MENFNNIYKDKVVLVTGHTGFKGSWLCIWLLELGAKVIGYALEPNSQKDIFVLAQLQDKMVDIRGDIRDINKLKNVFEEYKPEYVFHLAAQPLVRESYEKPSETYEVNVMGTIHVLECIRNTPATKVGVLITTDKCYDNKEQPWGYRENDALGGYDPYSSSKAAAEIAIQSWRNSFMSPVNYEIHQKAIASARAGNVIGGGDWAKDRLIPDCMRAIFSEEEIFIRNPQAIRPWQHVLEPLRGYLKLGEMLTKYPQQYSQAWNFGPTIDSIIPVGELVQKLIHCYGSGKVNCIQEQTLCHEANWLNLDISKSVFKLGWKPILHIDEAIRYTVEWYKQYQKEDCYLLSVKQITNYTDLMMN
ncbi:CDP-glucose 4,6-dehydratase [Cellulosilyticum lentocellum]|uniref:CDP-glucose 4,6-dehydratase n=1 Tax=Cellulosilyticum lentocellum (strain ATCC 49066 / DSM 5427 / NCIMB 11756 / RHM5) TaxID=642492 RepID=F2JLP0_CELLD|nr:CDP-glucose 4,6-dehydratase [Cellulosilyticum lentocellum]ADZ83431.1 CDP-glucose 4,6-dehydratase [Cellulosilyticum lentocellum DSM 5427]